jgi:small subunit ribosomal protein S16
LSVKLRLTRMGRRKRPFYRIVAADSRAPRDGKYLEKIGTYNPLTKPAEVQIDKEAALKWLLRGASPSETVRNLLSDHGVMFELDLRRRGLSAEQIELEHKKQEAVMAEVTKKQEAVAAMKKREEEKKTDSGARAKEKEQPAEEKSVVEPASEPAAEPTVEPVAEASGEPAAETALQE